MRASSYGDTSTSNMTGKSWLLFLTLVIMSVFVAAHRPITVEKTKASEPPNMGEVNSAPNKEKLGGNMRLNPSEVAGGSYSDPYSGVGAGFQLGRRMGFGGGWGRGQLYGPPSYAVVYPYPLAYGPPGAYMMPYQWPEMGHGLTPQVYYGPPGTYVMPYPWEGVGRGLTSQGYYSPKPPPRDNAQGSSQPQQDNSEVSQRT